MGWFKNKLQRPMDKRAERRILGKPCEGKPPARFDERGRRWKSAAPPTLRAPVNAVLKQGTNRGEPIGDRREWCSLQDHLGRYRPLQISEYGGLAKAHAAGGAKSGTAILAVTVTDQRMEACATFPHRNTANLPNHPYLSAIPSCPLRVPLQAQRMSLPYLRP
jgi:hypothetical protein